MAGMLPGVECARRRRFHPSGGGYSDSPTISAHSCTRRSSFCLYTSNHESHYSSISSLRCTVNQASQDEKLGGIAREAKERLDERLGTQRKSETKRYPEANYLQTFRKNGKESEKCMVPRKLHTEVFGSKKSGTKRFSWSNLSWKACEEEECAICLERFRIGETLVHLPCAHRFHARCLVPWLESNAHCPCCRMEIFQTAAARENFISQQLL